MSQLFQWRQRGLIRPMTPEGNQEAGACAQPPQEPLILTGSGITDHHGQWSFVVPPNLCPPFSVGAVDWVSMVATPSRQHDGDNFPHLDPLYVTTAWSTSGGLILFVKSWGPHGNEERDVPFSWHAAVMHHQQAPPSP
jgi:hypothetical protein